LLRKLDFWGEFSERSGMQVLETERATESTEPLSEEEYWKGVDPRVRELCVLLGSGITYRAACRKMQIDHGQMYRLTQRDANSRRVYSHARARLAGQLADETVEIADGIKDAEPVRAAQAAIASRQWLASKLDPATFGDRSKVAIEHTGSVDLVLTEEKRAKLIELRAAAAKFVENQALRNE